MYPMVLTSEYWQNYYIMKNHGEDLGKMIKRQRVMVPLTLEGLSVLSGVSPSHLGRIERGERYPSASILRNIAKPLAFDEDALFTLAGYLSPKHSEIAEGGQESVSQGLDPYVAKMLAREPIEVQRTVIGILTILKSISASVVK